MKLHALAFAIVLCLSACSKVTQENFSKIQDGMSEQEVTAILGSPTESSSGSILGISGTSSKWADGDAAISIQFVNGKVAMRNFNKSANRQ